MNKNNKKGFTLAELLIVVAIIGVLVAISIPIFTSQLEKSRDAVSVANMRSAYAEVMTCVLAGSDGQSTVTFTPKATGDKVAGTYAVTVAIKSQSANTWSGLAGELPFTAPDDPGTAGNKTLTFTVDANGGITTVALS
ncbi:MAG: prepilin-type N-terminal cleavage/methylation domain-containing protein [Solobacterium sp.]|nr:prepilin-type N-terminal cleavage/methylation domain-containing protein [Solobacterium sp.]